MYVLEEGLWLPEGAMAESHARQVRLAMEQLGEPEPITGPFDRIGRFVNFGWWAVYAYRDVYAKAAEINSSADSSS